MAQKTCFIISTIGEEGSNERKSADEKYDLVFLPILKELGYEVTRADKIGTPGSISYDIVNHIISSNLVIADVSDVNPNVFYELAIRNAVNKPVIVIRSPTQRLPFDIIDKRAISLDMKDARLWTKGKDILKQQIVEAEKDPKLASKSILSDFSFQIDADKKISPDTEMNLQLKDMKAEMRRLNKQISQIKNTGLYDSDSNIDDIIDDFRNSTAHQEVSRLQLFIDVLRSLEGDRKMPVEEKIFVKELIKTSKFTEEEARNFIRRMLREATIYESKPGYYNRI